MTARLTDQLLQSYSSWGWLTDNSTKGRRHENVRNCLRNRTTTRRSSEIITSPRVVAYRMLNESPWPAREKCVLLMTCARARVCVCVYQRIFLEPHAIFMGLRFLWGILEIIAICIPLQKFNYSHGERLNYILFIISLSFFLLFLSL